MLGTIIRKEMLDTMTSPKFVFTFLLCMILILLSVYTGINNYREEMREYSAAVAMNQSNLESQPSFGALAGLGTKITKPPEVLGTLIVGIQEAVGRSAKVNVAYDPSLEDSKYNSNPVFAVFGELDLTLIVKIVLSLFAILFTYDAIVGEKERGTLKLMLANKVPRDKLILGKAIGSFVSLLIPLLLGVLMLVAYPDISLGREEWLRVGLIFLLFLCYLSAFFTLGLFVSTRTNRASSSLLILLFLWVTCVTIIPRVAVMTAGRMERIPSMHEITAQKDAFLQEIQGAAPTMLLEWREKNPPPKGKGAKERMPEWQAKYKQFLEDIQQDLTTQIDTKNAEIEESYQAKRRSQQALATNLSRISPASALMFGTMSLGRTGIQEHERFQNSVKSYKPVFTKWVNAKMMRNIDMQTGKQSKPELGDMPMHAFQSESLQESLSRALPDFIILLMLVIVFFTGAFVSFLKYDVR